MNIALSLSLSLSLSLTLLQVYFHCLQNWVQVSSGHVLEEEWKHVKVICNSIRDCEAEAGRRFW